MIHIKKKTGKNIQCLHVRLNKKKKPYAKKQTLFYKKKKNAKVENKKLKDF